MGISLFCCPILVQPVMLSGNQLGPLISSNNAYMDATACCNCTAVAAAPVVARVGRGIGTIDVGQTELACAARAHVDPSAIRPLVTFRLTYVLSIVCVCSSKDSKTCEILTSLIR